MAVAKLDPKKVVHIVVHCSASRPSAKVDAAEIARWHRDRGFLKIGYHYVINRSGLVEPGRALDQVGAHAAGYNSVSVGVCLVGGLNDKTGAPENNFTEAQFDSLKTTLRALTEKFSNAKVLGHRDLPNVHKDCPCFDVASWWEEAQTK